MNRRMVRFKVTSELIKQALGMPDNANIYSIFRDGLRPDVFEFFVEHPDFDVVDEDSYPPEIAPVITVDFDKRPSTWSTFDWGLADDAG